MPDQVKANSLRLSPLALHDGFVWGWAHQSAQLQLQVHLYLDGHLVATEVTGQAFPLSLEKPCGKLAAPGAGFCFALPASVADGYEHQLVVALPDAYGDNVFSPVVTIAGSAIRGVVAQKGRDFVGSVWLQSDAPSIARLQIKNEHGKMLHRCKLQVARVADNIGYPASFSIACAELPPEPLHFFCDGQELRGSPCMAHEHLVSRVEAITPAGITGWVFDDVDLARPLELALRVDGKNVSWFRPNQLRTDVTKMLSMPDHALGVIGFLHQVPAELLDGQQHLVEVVSAATGKPLKGGHQWIHWRQHAREWPRPAPPVPVLATGKKPEFAAPAVSVIILNRNGVGVLQAFLASWEQHNQRLPAEIIVVDHASTDGSLTLLKHWRSRLDLQVIALKHNGSFSDSCNLGASRARADYLLFMNNDIIWLQDALPNMVASLQDGSTGIVGMKLLKIVNESLHGQHHASEVQHLGVRFKLNETGYWPVEVSPTLDNTEHEYSPQLVPAVTGAALLCRKQDFEAAGRFHSDYFYGFEDVEFCLRLGARLGKNVMCRNDCVALHHHGHTRLSGRELSIYDRVMHNSTVLESHIGLWIKQAWWKSLVTGDGFYTNEALHIGLVGSAFALAPALAAILPRAHILLLAPNQNWKEVRGLHLLVVGDCRYDIRSLCNQRADLLTIAYLENSAAAWSTLPWWHDFCATLAPAPVSNRLAKSCGVPVQASNARAPLGRLLEVNTPRLRTIIAVQADDPIALAKAASLQASLRKAGLPCWLHTSTGDPDLMADVCVRLTKTPRKTLPATKVAKGVLQVSWPISLPAPDADWIRKELEKQLGSTFCSS